MDNKPTALKVIVDNIPTQLKGYRQWLLWRYRERNGRWTKVPYQISGDPASSTDSATWNDFDSIAAEYRKGGWDGIGIALNNQLVGIDIDHIRGSAPDRAKIITDIVKRFTSYTEYSPSGDGIRIFIFGSLPPGSRKNKELGLEVYQDKRFLTITGKCIETIENGTVPLNGSVQLRQDEIDWFHATYFKPPVETDVARSNGETTLPDHEVIDKLRTNQKFNRLWNGDKSDYLNSEGQPDDSSADEGFCTILAGITRDPDQIDRLYAQSKMMRSKWNRSDYKASTIQKALAFAAKNYEENKVYEKITVSASAKKRETVASSKLLPILAFDPSLIPDPLRDWLVTIAENKQVPIEFAAIPAVIGLGSLLGRRVAIRPKVNEEWLVVPNLWGGVIAKAGMTKSDAAGDALRFITRMDRDLMHDFNRNMAQWQEFNSLIKSETDDHKREQMRAAQVPKPVRRQYTVDDITTQMLGEVLETNASGVLLRNDELGQWLLSFLRKGNETDRKFYLKCWSGVEDAKIQRIGRGFHYVAGACVSIFGTIQPGVIARYINAATANGEEADGLVQRLQLLVYPDTKPDFNLVDKIVDQVRERQVGKIFESFPVYDFGYHGVIGDLPYIRFTPKAQRFFECWLVEHQRRLRSSDLHSAVIGHLNKYNSLLPSLALIFHCVEMVHSDCRGPVSLAATELARRWVQYLESHAMRIYASVTDEEDRERLIKMIQSGKFKGPFTARDVIHQRQPGLTKAKRVTEILSELADEGMLELDKVSGIAPRFIWTAQGSC